ncbi:MAG: TetR family transcriptional regulator C-terminal domain-containing protein [Pseudomonadota bacterium]|nr:TetR family transcriptional regulator C-terminal domain-containing protein [Pseudomonadota bacterium]
MNTRPTETPQPGAQRPRRTIKRQQPGVRRQDLLQVTLECLSRLGPRGTTGREICRQAGVSHGLLRHYFTNPQNLLLETYEELCNQVITGLAAELTVPDRDAWVSLDAFFDKLFSDEWANTQSLGAWLAFWSLVRSDPEFAARNDALNTEVRRLLADAMSRLPQRPQSVSMDDTVAIMAATMDGLWFEYCLSPNRLARERGMELCKRTLRILIPEAA